MTFLSSVPNFKFTLQILPVLKRVEFLRDQNAPFERPQRPKTIDAMKCYAHHIFSLFHIFYVEMAASKGKDLHIHSWETTDVFPNFFDTERNHTFQKFFYISCLI